MRWTLNSPVGKINSDIYPEINYNIEYGLFEDVIDSYYLDSQIRDDFICLKDCYIHDHTIDTVNTEPNCTHAYHHISQQLNSLNDTDQQHKVYTSEMDSSLFTTDTDMQCQFNIVPSNFDSDNDKQTTEQPKANTGIHSQSKHKYQNILVMHMYSTMILTMVMSLHSQTNICTVPIPG